MRIKKTGVGLRVENDMLSALLYADYVVILREHHDELQVKVNVVLKYVRDFSVRFK